MPHGALEYWRPEGLRADGAVKVLQPHGDIKPLGAALSFSLRFSFSFAGAATIHRQQNSKVQALAWLVCASITNPTRDSLSTQSHRYVLLGFLRRGLSAARPGRHSWLEVAVS